jgi:5-methylcytosine-specific restriction endonuclease McrA
MLVERGRCTAHTKQVDVGRGTAQQRGYTYAWNQYSTTFRMEHPFCGERADGSRDAIHSRCVQQHLDTPAQCVDHTIPLTQGGSLWDEDNHMSACFACNTWKAQTMERGRAS